jgi:hypothetical protein
MPSTIDEERVAGLVRKTLQKNPWDGSTHWSVRQAAAETGMCSVIFNSLV